MVKAFYPYVVVPFLPYSPSALTNLSMENVGSAKFQFVEFNEMISVKSISSVKNQY